MFVYMMNFDMIFARDIAMLDDEFCYEFYVQKRRRKKEGI